MTREVRLAVIFLSLAVVMGCSKADIDNSVLFTVEDVIDGDTIKLSSGESVRYIGIDTPEIKKHTSSGKWKYDPQPFSLEAKEFNRNLVKGKSVRLEFDVEKHDHYGRLLAYCFVGDVFVNQKLLEEGLAMLYTYPPNVKYTDLFVNSLKKARVEQKGFWKEAQTITSDEAVKYIGFVKTINGQVVLVKNNKNNILLFFGDPGKKNTFRAVIFKNSPAYQKLRNSYQDLVNKTIRVWGTIKLYRQSPEIIISAPQQLEITGY